jgi:hypothetical protein
MACFQTKAIKAKAKKTKALYHLERCSSLAAAKKKPLTGLMGDAGLEPATSDM